MTQANSKTKNKTKELNFVEMFNKVKDTEYYKEYIKDWPSLKYLHKNNTEKLNIDVFDKRSKGRYKIIDMRYVALESIKDLYNYYFNGKKSKN